MTDLIRNNKYFDRQCLTYTLYLNFGPGCFSTWWRRQSVDYAAPGVDILSTYKGGRYAYASGTSMAAPHAAGVLLLTQGNFITNGTVTRDPDSNPDHIISAA